MKRSILAVLTLMAVATAIHLSVFLMMYEGHAYDATQVLIVGLQSRPNLVFRVPDWFWLVPPGVWIWQNQDLGFATNTLVAGPLLYYFAPVYISARAARRQRASSRRTIRDECPWHICGFLFFVGAALCVLVLEFLTPLRPYPSHWVLRVVALAVAGSLAGDRFGTMVANPLLAAVLTFAICVGLGALATLGLRHFVGDHRMRADLWLLAIYGVPTCAVCVLSRVTAARRGRAA